MIPDPLLSEVRQWLELGAMGIYLGFVIILWYTNRRDVKEHRAEMLELVDRYEMLLRETVIALTADERSHDTQEGPDH